MFLAAAALDGLTAQAADRTVCADSDGASAMASLDEYRATGDARQLDAAKKTLESITGRLYKKGLGILHSAEAEPGVPRLADQVFPALASLQLYQATGDGKYLSFAVEMATLLDDRFSDREHGGYFDASRDKPVMQNARAALLFIDLFHITGRKPYREFAARTLALFSGESNRHSTSSAILKFAADRLAATTYEFIVVGRAGAKDTAELIKKAYTYPDPYRVVVALDPAHDKGRLLELGYEYQGSAVMYVCSDKTCFPPVLPGGNLKKTTELIEKARKQ